MRNSGGDVIYVGKARSLKKRLASYFRARVDSAKTRALVASIAAIDVTLTRTEGEALVLENNYIKQYRPRYNVLLRDDKSYPYILLSQHKHPRLSFHRGPKKAAGEYFGPFPSGVAIRESLKTLQKLFAVRQCQDVYYRSRSRPCLEYQLNRCTAPCVGKVSDQAYAEQVAMTRDFLKGRSSLVIEHLVEKMNAAAQQLDFELAAQLRDRIAALKHVQQSNAVEGGAHALDAIGICRAHGITCVHLLTIRGGKVLGSKSLFPKVPADTPDSELIDAVLQQYYLSMQGSHDLPSEILLPDVLNDSKQLQVLLSDALASQIRLNSSPRSVKARFLELANTNAAHAAHTQLMQNNRISKRFAALQDRLALDSFPQRIECFDISHTSGQNTVASCVVFNPAGPQKKEYRLYNISGITPGDDYAAMYQALSRRFKQRDEQTKLPSILLIDGGKGQLAQAEAVIDGLEWPEAIIPPLLIGVAKGESRKPGLETLIMGGSHDEINLRPDDPALHLIQHVRDESHRFAITGHRKRRQKQIKQSPLEQIAGVGPKRRQQLLNHFGGLQQLRSASIEDISRIPGISHALAAKIYAQLQNH